MHFYLEGYSFLFHGNNRSSLIVRVMESVKNLNLLVILMIFQNGALFG